MKTSGLLTVTLCVLCMTRIQLYADPQWNLNGLEDNSVNCLLFDYLLDGGSNLLAGTSQGIYFFDTSNVLINTVPVVEDFTENLRIRNVNAGLLILEFSVKTAGKVHIDILNLSGRTLSSYTSTGCAGGKHKLSLDVKNGYSNGLYVLRLSADEKQVCKKFISIRN